MTSHLVLVLTAAFSAAVAATAPASAALGGKAVAAEASPAADAVTPADGACRPRRTVDRAIRQRGGGVHAATADVNGDRQPDAVSVTRRRPPRTVPAQPSQGGVTVGQ